MKKGLMFGVLSIIGATALAACGGSSKATWGKNYILAIGYNDSDPFISDSCKPGLTENYADYGFSQINWKDAANKDENALKYIDETLTDTNCAGYAINVVDINDGPAYLNKIKTTKKPVVFWNRELSKKLSDGTSVLDTDTMNSYANCYYSGFEVAEGGRLQGSLMASYINDNKLFTATDRNGDGKLGFLMIRGQQIRAAEERCIYAPIWLDAHLVKSDVTDDEIAADTNYNKLNFTTFESPAAYSQCKFQKVEYEGEVQATTDSGSDWDATTAAKKTKELLTADKDKKIDVIISNNDNMAVSVAALDEFKNIPSLKIVGVDALDSALALIKADDRTDASGKNVGRQYVGTVKMDGYRSSEITLQLLENMAEGKDINNKMTVVSSKSDWSKDMDSVWYESAKKSFRIHHTLVTKESLSK